MVFCSGPKGCILQLTFGSQKPEILLRDMILINGQLSWTCLPQRYENSPTIFDEFLHEDLGEYRVNNSDITPVQYVDDLLNAAETKEMD